MTRSFHPALVALGLSTAYLLAIFAPLVSAPHTAVYHLAGPISSVVVPVLLNFVLLWLALTALLLIARRSRRLDTVVWWVLLVSLPWIVLKNLALLQWFPLKHHVSVALFSFTAFLVLCTPLVFHPSVLSQFERLRHFMTVLLSFTAFSGIILVGQVIWVAYETRDLNDRPYLHQPVAAASTPRPRIIWLLLDELSYQQLYEQRYPGLALPAFDRLASQSVVFTQVQPVGNVTESAVPALMTGDPVERIRVSTDGRELSLLNRNSTTWYSFDPHHTVFQQALDAGYSTAIAGWYNPYCRIMPQVLDRCFWTAKMPVAVIMVPGESIASNMMQIVHRLFTNSAFLLFHRTRSTPGTRLEKDLHVNDFETLMRESDNILTNPSSDFVFLHLPIPHPPGIYNRRSRSFTNGNSSYVDNLALADDYLAHVRRLLEQQNAWDSSTIVVMGDHSWRNRLLWAPQPTWTPEDQAASHNVTFDSRPAYIVKLPNQQQGTRFDAPFSALRTRALFDGLLQGQLRTPDDLAAWASRPAQAIAVNSH